MRTAALVLALVAGTLGLPAAVCSGVCAAAIGAAGASDGNQFNEELTDEQAGAAGAIGSVFMCAGIFGAIAYLIGGLLVLRAGKAGAILCVIGSLLTALTLITFNPLSLLVLIIGIVATILAFIRPEPTPLPAAA